MSIEEITLKFNQSDVDEFTDGYITCALWCGSGDEEDQDALDDTEISLESFDTLSKQGIISDCTKFMTDNHKLLKGLSMSQSGHDFWLTRNHHGTGFWDRGLGEIGDKLTTESFNYSALNAFILKEEEGTGETGKICLEG